MEVDDPADPLGARGQEGGPNVQRPGFLAEAYAGHKTDTGLVEQFVTVEFVGFAVGLFGSFNGSWREVDRGEEVHGSLEHVSMHLHEDACKSWWTGLQ